MEKSIQTNKLKMKQQLQDIWYYASFIAKKEDEELTTEPPTNKELNKENLEATVERLNEVLGSNKKVHKKQRAKLLYIKKKFGNNLKNKINKKKYSESVIAIVKRIRMQLLCA